MLQFTDKKTPKAQNVAKSPVNCHFKLDMERTKQSRELLHQEPKQKHRKRQNNADMSNRTILLIGIGHFIEDETRNLHSHMKSRKVTGTTDSEGTQITEDLG